MLIRKKNGLHLTITSEFLSVLLIVTFILLFSLPGYAQKVVDLPTTDAAIESRLDEYLNVYNGSDIEPKALLKEILTDIDDTTPLMTEIRAKTYWAAALLQEEKFAKAHAILDKLQQQANRSDLVDARAEILANRIDYLAIEGKRGDAFLLVPELERILADTVTPRIRYYAHNLLSSIYVDWQRHEAALTHLLDAQKALNEMDSELNEGRRIYLLRSIANIQLALEQWSPAIKTVEDTIDDAVTAGFDGLAYDLWFSKYYAQASLGDYETALDSLQRAYAIANQIDLDFQKVIILNNYGDAYMKLGQLDEAEQHLLDAREQALALDFTEMLSTIEFNLGYIAVKRGDSLGIEQMRRVTEQFRQDDSLPPYELEQLLGELADAHKLRGDYKSQAKVLEERLQLRQQITEQSQQQQMAELQAVYKSRDDAQQIQLLEQQNQLKEQVIRNTEQQRVIWVLFVVIAVVSLALMFLLYRKSRRMNQQLNKANEHLADQSLRDPLTGLWNRRALQDAMLRRQPENFDQPDGLLLLDIDYFKKVNDKHGHGAGDKVLLEVCKRLQAVCRDSDILVRWGGEEFLFYVENVDINEIKQLAERVLRVVAQDPIEVDGDEITTTATIGFIQLPFAHVSEELVDWERALQIADMALYTGKAQGRNRACGVTKLNVGYDEARQALEHDLGEALDNNWIELITIKGPQR